MRVEFDIDGETAFAADVAPSGIAGDGPSRIHERFVLPAGSYEIAIRMRDRPSEAYDWEASQTVQIGSADDRVVDFRPDAGGFVFH